MTLEEALAAIQRVRDLHESVPLIEVWPTGAKSAPDDHPVCVHCTDPDAGWYASYPCPTIEALDGTVTPPDAG